MNLTISALTVTPTEDPKNVYTRANVEIVLNEVLFVDGLRVVEGRNGLFVSWPASCNPEGREWKPVVKPLSSIDLARLDAQIMRVYLETVVMHAESEVVQ